jgi:hypothetical protein
MDDPIQEGMSQRRIRLSVPTIHAVFEAESTHGEGHLGNVSRTGLFMRTNTLPECGESVCVVFTDSRGQQLKVWGTVQWIRGHTDMGKGAPPGFGLEIEVFSGDYNGFIDYLASLV